VKANVAIKVKRGTVPLSGTVEIAKSPVSGQMPGRVLVDTFTKIQEYTVADLAGTSSVTLPSDPSGRATATTTAPAAPVVTAPTVPDDQLVAKGTVRLINKYSKAQPLVRTTQLVTEDGKIYRIDKNVNIPSGGSVTVSVYADKPGAAYAIAPSTFKILKLWKDLQPLIYAVSDEAFVAVPSASPAPAPSKPVTEAPAPKPTPAKAGPVVTEQMIAAAERRLTDAVVEQAKKNLLARITDSKLDDVVFYVHEADKPKTNVVAGQVTDSFMASVKLDVVAVLFSKDDLTALVRTKLKERVPEGREFLPINLDSVQLGVESFNATAETAVVKIQANGEYRLTATSPLLQKNVIAGKTKDEALTILRAVEGVDDVQVTITPSWFSKIPALKDHIDIRVE
jgi:hypothetical protein